MVNPTVNDFSCVIVSEEGGAPVALEAPTLDGLLAQLYPALVQAKSGWCYVNVKGQRVQISSPSQIFQLKLPDGTLVKIEDPAKGAFDANNRFSTLQPFNKQQ